MNLRFTVLAVLAFGLAVGSGADDIQPEDLQAPVLVVADAVTGTVVFEKQPDLFLPPASLAKLMTLHLSLEDVRLGRLDESAVYAIPEGGRAEDMRPRSGVLGLADGDRATLLTLQRAAAVASANDAAWSLALLSAGDGNLFVTRMNREAKALGMADTAYVDPDGWSGLSASTGRDQMTMALAYLERHPEALEQLHSLPEMIYLPEDELMFRSPKKNTNLLIETDGSIDGLKTGTIPSAGYHFIATARRGNTRFIALVMGLRALDFATGLERRAREAAFLLDWAFGNYTTWTPAYPALPEIPLRHGREDAVRLVPAGSAGPVTVPRESIASIRLETEIPESLTAPLESGTAVGVARWLLGDDVLAEDAILAAQEAERRWRIRDFLNLRR